MTLRTFAIVAAGSLLAACLGAAALGLAGFFVYYLFQPAGNCGVVGCWDGLVGAGIGAALGAAAAAVISWRFLSKRLRRF